MRYLYRLGLAFVIALLLSVPGVPGDDDDDDGGRSMGGSRVVAFCMDICLNELPDCGLFCTEVCGGDQLCMDECAGLCTDEVNMCIDDCVAAIPPGFFGGGDDDDDDDGDLLGLPNDDDDDDDDLVSRGRQRLGIGTAETDRSNSNVERNNNKSNKS